MTIKQIAKTLGVSERSVEGKIYRAKKTFAQTFRKKFPEILPISQKSD